MSQLISIKVQEDTLAQTDRILKKLKAPSRSDVIRRAIGLSDILINSIEHGDKLYIESKGQKREILIPGLSN